MNPTFEERQREEKAPLPFKIFKGVKGKFGAMRVNFKRPWTNDTGKKQEGVVFVEMAPPVGNNVYDWENNKIVLALGITDVCKLLHFFKAPNKYKDESGGIKISIYHDKDAGTRDRGQHVKILNVTKGNDNTNFFVNLTESKDKQVVRKATITLSPDEAIGLMTLLESIIPSILSWTAIGEDVTTKNMLIRIGTYLKEIKTKILG